jgi:hypothetical protein
VVPFFVRLPFFLRPAERFSKIFFSKPQALRGFTSSDGQPGSIRTRACSLKK